MFKIFVDLHYTDPDGNLMLTTNEGLREIDEQKMQLYEGQQILLYDDDEFDNIPGTVLRCKEWDCWVAKIDWDSLNKYHIGD